MKRPPLRASAPFLRRVTLLSEKTDAKRHPFNIEALRGLDLELRSNVTFFVGENGSGKSTLLEAVAKCCGFNVHGGGRDHQGAADQDQDDLAAALRLSWLPKATDGFFMRAESFFNFATYIDQVSTLKRYGGRRLNEQSHGESFLTPSTTRSPSSSWTRRTDSSDTCSRAVATMIPSRSIAIPSTNRRVRRRVANLPPND